MMDMVYTIFKHLKSDEMLHGVAVLVGTGDVSRLWMISRHRRTTRLCSIGIRRILSILFRMSRHRTGCSGMSMFDMTSLTLLLLQLFPFQFLFLVFLVFARLGEHSSKSRHGILV